MQPSLTLRFARAAILAALTVLLPSATPLRGGQAPSPLPSGSPAPAPRHERGLPLMRVFRTEDFNAGSQSFAIAQDARGLLYFGNLGGVLTYDGAWWSLVELPGKPAVLALAAGAAGRVGVGSINQFGYTSAAPDGTLAYHSLVALLPAEDRQLLGDIRGVCADGNGFLFATERMLLAWDGAGSIRIAADYRDAPGARRCFASGGRMYLAGGDGLQQLGGVTSAAAAAGASARSSAAPAVSFAGRTVDAVTPGGIVAVRGEGLFTLDGAPYAPVASQWLRDKTVAAVTELPQHELAVLTIEDGLIVADAAGAIVQRIDSDAGLPELALTDGLYDREGALWATANGGIARIDLSSPATELDARQGLRGAVNDVARFQDVLYAATSHGLFRFDSTAPLQAHRVTGIPSAAWGLLRQGDDLFVATGSGLYRLTAGHPPALVAGTAKMSVYAMLVPRRDPATMWIASRAGVGRLRMRDGTWHFDRLIPHGKPYTRTLAEHGDSIFCGTVFNGILRIHPDDSVQQYGQGEMSVVSTEDRLMTVSPERKIYFLDAHDRLVLDPRLEDVKVPPNFFAIALDRHGNVWLNSVPPSRIARRADGTFEREARPVASATVGDIQTVQVDEEGIVWFGSDRGLLRYEPPASVAPTTAMQPLPAISRAVAGRDRVLFNRFASPRSMVRMPHGLGRLRIEFSPMTFRPPVAYQYRLDPVDADWSRWSEEPFIDYTNLPAGDYRFRMRVRGGSGDVSQEVRWQFGVLPPWYRAPVATLLWIALAAGLLFAIVRLRTGALQRQAEKLRSRVSEQTIELRETVRLLKEANVRLEDLSTHDELTGVANRRSFVTKLAEEWELANARREPVALIMFDLDHFKEMNDSHGHQAGDEVLRRIGAFLGESSRGIAARYGGEEFAVLLPNTSLRVAADLAEQFRSGIERLGIGVTASFGIAAMVPAYGTAPHTLIRRADDALYLAKRSGRNCVRLDDAAVA
jgi:diguanylate cyclase (GGDEF)-like protein